MAWSFGEENASLPDHISALSTGIQNIDLTGCKQLTPSTNPSSISQVDQPTGVVNVNSGSEPLQPSPSKESPPDGGVVDLVVTLTADFTPPPVVTIVTWITQVG
ncbi:hypothetical protein EJ05DRAFT_505991 [Pseudovirgaria hyperparasitica]|uniref:Uncharacterized protein n=1 Tax=Pseudovirgaria hyperparasitica TaxID=470096 RepID=A0A6A6VTE2_9PEZI|nr:uncharacterized protein EJ05DRAFT_505991 [Pseudovirgaria hyperparasitica]KAF2752507.1 hypothetical protein EJ05DRAFT_505991 [Pseudovirgaria hyperparasitica]